MTFHRKTCAPLAPGLLALLWLAASGCASTRPGAGVQADPATSAARHRPSSDGGIAASIRGLMDAGDFPAAESLAAVHLAQPPDPTPEPSQIADVLDLLVEALVEGGRWWEPAAQGAIEHSLEIRTREPGPDSLKLAETLYVLAHLRSGRWDNRGAIEAYERSLRIRERALGPAHPEVLAARRRIGWERLQVGDRAGADSVLRKAAESAERALRPDDPGRIEGDVALAMLATQTGSRDTTRFAGAIARTERLLGPWHPLLAERLVHYSEFLRGLARYDRAHQLMVRAHGICERAFGPNNLRTAKLWNLIGVNYVWRGQEELALPYFEQSAATIRVLLGPDHLEMCKPHQDLGNLLCGLGNSAAGIPMLERALEIADRELPGDHWLMALALYHLGGSYIFAGQSDRARPLLERLLAIRRRTLPAGAPEIGRAMDLLAQSGVSPARARELYEGAAHIYLEAYGPDHPLGGRALALLSVYRQVDGDTLGAIQMCDSSIAVLTRTRGPDCIDVGWSHFTLGRLYRSGGRFVEAAHRFERAAEVFARSAGSSSTLVGMSLRQLGEVLAAAGDAHGAFRVAGRAEEIRRDHIGSNARYMAESEALTLLGSWASGERTSGLNLLLSLAAGSLADDVGARNAAWDALIRGRAMVLDELGSRHRSWAAEADPEVTRLAARFDSTSRRLSNLNVLGVDPARAEESRARLQRARADRDLAARALAERSARFREAQARDGMGLDSILAALPRGSALVAYARYAQEEWRGSRWVWQPSCVAFVMDEGGATAVVRLGDARRLDTLVTDWRRELDLERIRRLGEREADRRFRRVGERLRRAAWDPLLPHLGNSGRVFIVADGSLGLVNFATLPVGSSRYLLEQGPMIHYLTCERDLARGREPPSAGRGLLAMGAPAFDSDPAPTVDPGAALAAGGYRGPRPDCIAFGDVRFAALPAAGDELEAIADLWRRGTPPPSQAAKPDAVHLDVLTGARATETEFRARASGRQVVHLATHGFFIGGVCAEPGPDTRGIGGMVPAAIPAPPPRAAVNPLRLSGLALAGANLRARALPDQDDGILTAEEIASLDLTGVQWAVLSACETGVGEYHPGEGVMGFRRAFLIAGARTTIMSLWPVSDQTAGNWMRALYDHHWLRGLDTADAVRAASLEELRARRAAGLADHPVHWGAFIAVGDWR